MILDQTLQKSKVILLQDISREHSLLRWALRDLVLHQAPIVFLNDGQHVFTLQSCELRAVVQIHHGSALGQGFGFVQVNGGLTHVDEFPENFLHLVLKDDDLSAENLSVRCIFGQEVIERVGFEASVCV